MPNGRSILRRSLVLLATLAIALCGGAALAQSAPADASSPPLVPVRKVAPTKRPHSVSGSPLDTLRSTHLWTDTAPVQDFVRESRPDPGTLGYAPLTGTDPERPKPRDAANVQALQAELERDLLSNENKARGAGGAVKKARKATR